MRMPGLDGLALLAWLLVLAPMAAWRSRRAVVAAASGQGAPLPARTVVLWRTIVLLAVLLWVSVVIAGRIGLGVFTYGPMPVAGWALGAAVLVACLGVRAFMRALTSDAERAMAARRAWAPQTARERWLFVGAAVLAGIAEEAAYRGVGWQVLSWTLGDRSIVAMWILSVAFALAHRVQGWAAMVGIGVMAVLMHLLVWRTETLLVAIAVHVAYDLLVGLATPWRSAASHSAA